MLIWVKMETIPATRVTVYLEKWTAKPLGTNNSILKEMEEIGL
jgi:hypothetical protein